MPPTDITERGLESLIVHHMTGEAAMVTGKLDVREAALSFPEEDVVEAAEDLEDEAEEPELEAGE